LFAQDAEIIRKLKGLPEPDLRRLIRIFFAKLICKGNVQPYHGINEHGKDTIAMVDPISDPLGNPEVLYIQVKVGDITSSDWRNDILGQMTEALNTTGTGNPLGFSKDYPRRLLLITNGELQPEVHNSIKGWNDNHLVPIEVFDIKGLCKLFDRYNVRATDFEELLNLAKTLNL
jgi:hypothetical protein